MDEATVVSREDKLDLPGECEHIIKKAMAGEGTIVNLLCLVFVALASGDAFVFDIEDKFACPLCLNGERRPYAIHDTGKQWAFEWPYKYMESRGGLWLVSERDGQKTAIKGLRPGLLERAVEKYNEQAGTKYHF